MVNLLFILFTSIIFLNSSGAQSNQVDPHSFDHFVLLDSSKADRLVKQCSRYSPKIEGSWNPSIVEIKELEENILEVTKITAEKCCSAGKKIDNIDLYYRQYVGIIVDGKKLIYINAFPSTSESNYWKERPCIVCDGGYNFWGVIYDPVTKKFHDLAFNGEA